MKVLVTGGAGYVGGVSVDAIIAAGHEVVVLDDLTTGHAPAVNPAARLVAGTYADEAATRALLEAERVDAILHCAARSLVGESIANPAKYYRDNVAGGVALLEAARAVGVGRIVFSSTAATYGVPDATPIPEDAPLRPINPYGETKRTFEGALRWYGSAYGLRSVILRYFNVAGATERLGEVHRPETHLIPNVLIAAGGRPGADAVRRGLPDARRHAGARLHPRVGPRRCPRRGARGHGPRRRADRPDRRRRDGPGHRQPGHVRRVLGEGRPARGGGDRRPADPAHGRARAGRATRRCSWRRTSARGRSSAGRRAAPRCRR